jgi:hypothetical protein
MEVGSTMGLATKAGGLLAMWEAIAAMDMFAMVMREPLSGKVTSKWQSFTRSWR